MFLESTAYVNEATYVLDQIYAAPPKVRDTYLKDVADKSNPIIRKAMIIKAIQDPDPYKEIVISVESLIEKNPQKARSEVEKFMSEGEGEAYTKLENKIIELYEIKIDSVEEGKSDIVNPGSMAIIDGLRGDSLMDWAYP